MASKNIRGLTVEIGGDTTELTAALKNVDKASKASSDELREIDRLLKLDPKNTELLAQKQKVLADAIGSSKEKLDILKKAEQDAQAQFEKGDIGAEQMRALQREVVYAENKLKKLEQQFVEVKKAADAAGDDTTELTAALKNVDKASKASSDELREIDRLLKLDPKNTELLAQKQKVLADAIGSSKEKLDILKKAEQDAQAQFEKGDIGAEQMRALQREVVYAENKLKKLEQQFVEVKKAADAAGDEIEDTGKDTRTAKENTEDLNKELDKLKGKYNDAKAAAKDAGKELAATAAAGVAVVGASVAVALNYEDALDAVQIQTGASAEEMTGYKAAMEAVFSAGLGEDLNDVANTMAVIAQQTHETDPAKLQELSENALILKDSLGFEVAEQMRAVTMLTTQFGISASEAYNLIVQGAQNGLNKNGDLLDVINEYGVHYKNLGYDAAGFFNSLLSGTQTGVFSVDNLGNAMKEFGIRVKDENATTSEAYERLGLDADELRAKFAEGGDSAREAARIVNDALFSMSDEVAQNAVGVALYGTMWEDMGKDAIFAIHNVNGEISGTVDAMGAVRDVRLGSTSTQWASLGRTVQTELIAPLGEKLLPLAKEFIDFCIENMDTLLPILKTVGATIAAIFVLNKVSKFISSIKTLISTFKALKTASTAASSASVAGFGAVGAAIAAVCIALEVVDRMQKAVLSELKSEIGSFLAQSEAIRALAAEYSSVAVEAEKAARARELSINASASEFDQVEDLVDELETLIDAEGRVLEGHEDRVQYIEGRLSEATGLEIEQIEGLIGTYDELAETIDGIILKKRAEAALTLMGNDYSAAVAAVNGDADTAGSYLAYEKAVADYEANKNTFESYAYYDAMMTARRLLDVNLSVIDQYEALDYAIATNDRQAIQQALFDAQTGMIRTRGSISASTLSEEAYRRATSVSEYSVYAQNPNSSVTPDMIEDQEQLFYQSVYEWITAAIAEGLDEEARNALVYDLSRIFAGVYGIDLEKAFFHILPQFEAGTLDPESFAALISSWLADVPAGSYDDIYDWEHMRVVPDAEKQKLFERAYDSGTSYEEQYPFRDRLSVLYSPELPRFARRPWELLGGVLDDGGLAMGLRSASSFDDSLDRSNNKLLSAILDRLDALDLTLVLDDDVLVAKTAGKTDIALGKAAVKNKRGSLGG